MRRIFVYFMAAVAAAFLWVLFAAPNTYAVNATWENTNTINYDGNTYRGPASKQVIGSFNLSDKTQVYTYVEPEDTTNTVRKIHILYFETVASPGTAQPAKYKSYTYIGPYTYSDPSAAANTTIDPQAASSTASASSCTVSGGLGWIICPVTNFLASGVDWVFGVVSSFLTVAPTTTNPDSALFRAWTYMRSFANVAFVIAFLIIIYSQLTSFGISNYGIKKLLPRLIIAALLVNLSYYICAIAVDISNILGHSIQSVFINIRNNIMATTGNSWDYFSWTSITGFILSGGTAAAVGVTGLVLTLSTYGIAGSLFLLLPSLMAALMAVLVALLVLAARQAVITILIILAPLAFVAYLLPNTEKWFEKWQSTFMTMLIIFPAFSVIFGGSQLASAAIIQNADSINLIILGLLVQTAPLFITPILLKVSGSMLNKVAGLVSNTNKGLLDRTRKFTDDRAGNIAARRLGEAAQRHQILRRNAQAIDQRRRRREGLKGAHTGMADARWANTNDFSNIDRMVRESADRKSIGENRSELRYNTQRTIAGSRIQNLDSQLRETKEQLGNVEMGADNLYKSSAAHQTLHEAAYRLDTQKNTIEQTLDRDLKNRVRNNAQMLNEEMTVRIRTDEASGAKARLDTIHEGLRAGVDSSVTGTLGALATQADAASRDQSLTELASESAKRIQKGNLYTDLTTVGNPAASIAAGIDPYGEVRARAGATSAIDKINQENVAAAGTLLSSQNYTPTELLAVARGRRRDGTASNTEEQQAAAKEIIQIGYEPDMVQLINDTTSAAATARASGVTDPDNVNLQKALGDYLKTSSKKPKYFPGPMLGKLSRGEMTESVDDLIGATLTSEKLSMEVFGDMPVEEMIRVNTYFATPAAAAVLNTDQKRSDIINTINRSIADPIISAKFTPAQSKALADMLASLGRMPDIP